MDTKYKMLLASAFAFAIVGATESEAAETPTTDQAKFTYTSGESNCSESNCSEDTCSEGDCSEDTCSEDTCSEDTCSEAICGEGH